MTVPPAVYQHDSIGPIAGREQVRVKVKVKGASGSPKTSPFPSASPLPEKSAKKDWNWCCLLFWGRPLSHSYAPHFFASAKRLPVWARRRRGKCGLSIPPGTHRRARPPGHSGRLRLGGCNPGLALRATAGAIQGATPSGALGTIHKCAAQFLIC